MPSEKTDSVVLSISPYRETSSILRLFTRNRGLIHGIVKGNRRGGKSSIHLDRGFIIESQVYYRPNRELHTLGSPHVISFFHAIRSNIIKSSVRDIALELYLKTITQSEPHPELFELIADFLAVMDETPSQETESVFPALWRFIRDYCSLMGFGVNIGDDTYAPATSRTGFLGATDYHLQYCRRHFDIRGQFNSFEFLKSVFA